MANIRYKVSSDATQYLEPAGSSIIDIVNDFNWTLTPKAGRENVPKIYLKEYQQTAGQLTASLLYIFRLGLAGNLTLTGTNTPGELYKNKYFAKETGWNYVMPYFNPKKYTRATTFSDENTENPFTSVSDLGRDILQGVANKRREGGLRHGFEMFAEARAIFTSAVNLVNRAIPGRLNLDLPRFFTGTSEGEYNVTFDLFNTGTEEDIINNRNFCEIITRNNTQSRRNAMITDPVCIYDIHCGDVVHMPAAYISNLEITNLGNTRSVANLFDGVKKVIPEAYRIKLSFQSLLQPSRQIMDGLDKGELVEAISVDADVNRLVESIAKKAESAAVNARSNVTNAATQIANATSGTFFPTIPTS